LTTFRTRSRVSAPTAWGLLFNTRETVVGDTPARLATSMMVGIWFGPGGTWLELISFQGSDGKAFPSHYTASIFHCQPQGTTFLHLKSAAFQV
jgi:hypothetical protein